MMIKLIQVLIYAQYMQSNKVILNAKFLIIRKTRILNQF